MGKKQTATPPKQYDDFFKAFEDIKNSSTGSKPLSGSGIAGAMAPTFRGTDTGFGESTYDESFNWNADADFSNLEGSINENRAQTQPWLAKAGAGIARVGVKAVSEIAKMPGYIGGVIGAGFADENEGFNTAFNNSWVQAVDSFNQNINEDVLPVYVKDAVKNGNLWENLSSVDFWATEGADGLGYIVSMFAPGAALKSLGVAGKVAEGTQMLDKVLNAGGKLALGEKAVANGLITTANTLFEAGSEAGSAMNAFTENKGKFVNDLVRQGYTPEDAEAAFTEQRGRLGRDMFLTNVAILALPNYINTRMLYGTGGKAVTRGLFDDTGKLVSQIEKPSFLNRLYGGGKQFGEALASEGFFEEGLQSTAENVFKKGAQSNTLDENSFKDLDLKTFGKEYLDILTTTDGQKAIALGGLLGGPMQIIGHHKQTNRDIKSTNDYLSLLQQNSDIYLANNTNADVYKRTTFINPQTGEFEYEIINGKKVIDPVKLNNITAKAYNSSKFSEMFDIAQNTNDKETLTALKRLSQDNLVIPMITGNEVGREMLQEYLSSIEDISKEDKDEMLKKADKLQLTHDQFIDLGIKPSDLGDSDIDIQDKLDYHQLLNNSLLVNESQKLSLENDLKVNKEKMREIFVSKNLGEVFNDDINNRQINEEISKDIRLERLSKESIKLQDDLLKINNQTKDFWDKSKNKKAFNDFLKERNKIRENNSPEKLDTANTIADNINNANTVDEVNEVINPTKVEVTDSENPSTPVEVKEVKNNVTTIEDLDPYTQDILKDAAATKIGELAIQTEEDVVSSNGLILQEKAVKKNDQFESLKINPLGETIDGQHYQYLNFGDKHSVIVNGNYEDVKTFDHEDDARAFIFNDEIETVETEDLDYHEPQTTIEFEPNESEPNTFEEEVTNTELENIDNKEDESNSKKVPSALVLGINKDGSLFQYASPKFQEWLSSLKNKVGTTVGFSVGELSEYGNNQNSVRAVSLMKLYSNSKFSSEDLQTIIQHLPLKVLIENKEDTFSFIPTISLSNPDINSPAYIARKNIIEGILNSKGETFSEKLNNTKTFVQYQKSGKLNYVKPETTTDVNGNKISVLLETNVATLDEFNNNTSKVPLYFVKDDFNIMNEKGENTVFPSTLTSNQKGYIYTLIHSTNGMKVPVKLNSTKLQESHADLIYNVYQTLYDKNKNSNVKRNQYITKLVDLFAENPELESQVKDNFQKELNVFKSVKDITVADFMTLFIHDNLNFDGTTKPYTTKFKGAGITFGQDSFVNFSRETEDYKNAFKNFIVTQKRQNVKLDFLAGVTKNVKSEAYKEYVLNNVLSTNIDPTQPFKGDNNIFIDTVINNNPAPEVTQIITSETTSNLVENNTNNTRNSEINPLSLSSAFSEDELFNLSEDDFSDLDETPPTKC